MTPHATIERSAGETVITVVAPPPARAAIERTFVLSAHRNHVQIVSVKGAKAIRERQLPAVNPEEPIE